MTRHLFRPTRLLTLAATTLAVLAATAAPASALAYDYTDPTPTGCSSTAITVASTPIVSPGSDKHDIGILELRWSTACKTNWGRVTRTDGGTDLIKVSVTRAATSDSTTELLSGYTQVYSDQLYGQGYTVCTEAIVFLANANAYAGPICA